MNIAQLDYFLTASRTLNFTRAAAEHFTSRQNLSHAVKDLERELGVALFTSEGGKLSLTLEGTEAAKRAKRVLDEVHGLKQAFAPQTADAFLSVAVGLNVISCTSHDVTAALDAYGGPLRMGEYSCRECYERVVDGAADVAIVGCMDRTFERCEYSLVAQTPLFLLVNSDSELAAKGSLDILDLAGHRLVMLPGFEFQFEPFANACKARGLDMTAVDVISSVGLMLRTVRRNDAVGIASGSFWEDPPHGTKVVRLSDPGMRVNLYMLYRNAAGNARTVQAFVSCVKGKLR